MALFGLGLVASVAMAGWGRSRSDLLLARGGIHQYGDWHTGAPTHESSYTTSARRNGWGYSDTRFYFSQEDQEIKLSGNRYIISGHTFPALLPWVWKTLSLDMSHPAPAPQAMSVIEDSVPPPNISQGFMDALLGLSPPPFVKQSQSNGDRLDHSHGQTLGELYDLRYGKISDYVDLVVWPSSHSGVVEIVKLAVAHNVGIIPFGGGTSVCLAVQRPEGEKRMVVSLDMRLMNRILELNLDSMTVLVEAGCVGQDLERELKLRGYSIGHEPDSIEFSTVGGWVATRASGMKKNTYGNIEDLLVNVKLVTGHGEVLTRNCQGPRVSTGPDVNQLVIGSEGTLGVITEARFTLRPVPKYRIYGSLLMPSYEAGFQVMREVAFRRIQPASIRLMDPLQFQLGHTLKPKNNSLLARLASWIQKFYVTKVLGFDNEAMSAITLLFEGEDQEALKRNMREIVKITKQNGGIDAGGANGERGYQMTYAIGYLREFSMDYQFVTESFETAVPWDKALKMCENVKRRIKEGSKRRGIPFPPFIACRVTQTYDAGCCVYFYFGFVYNGMEGNPAHLYHDLESEARDEIEASGGSLSHHHGIGKLRKTWMKEAVSAQGLEALKGLKKALDPKNIFCAGNLIDVD